MKKLTWLAALLFILYAGITVVATVPLWSQFSGTEAFSIVKHLVVLLALVVYMVIQPRIGSWFIAMWGVGVPLDKYAMLGKEFLAGDLGASGMLAASDEFRLLLLLIGTGMSAIVAVKLISTKKQGQESGANA